MSVGFNANGIFYDTYNPSQLRKQSFADSLLRNFPNGTAPLLALIGEINKKKAVSTEHGYFTKTMAFVKPVINNSGGYAGGDTTLTVTSTEGIVSGTLFEVPSTREVIRVTADPSSATSITVARAQGRIAAAAIPNSTELMQIGNAHARASSRPTARTFRTDYIANYTSIVRNAWALSETDRNSMANAGWENVAENEADAALLHSADIEAQMWWGQAMAPTGTPPRHTTQGIIDAIYQYAPSNVITAGSTTNYSQLMAMMEPMFKFTSNMGDPTFRVIFCDSVAMRVFQDIGRYMGTLQQMMGESNNSFGVQYTKFRTYKGVVAIKEHPLFNSLRTANGLAVVTDLPTINVAYLGDRNAKPEQYELGKNANGQDAIGGSFTSEFAMEVTSPITCGIIKGLTAGVA